MTISSATLFQAFSPAVSVEMTHLDVLGQPELLQLDLQAKLANDQHGGGPHLIGSASMPQPDFRDDLYRARELRGDWAFGEQILAIADDIENDYRTAVNGRRVPDKELVLRSKLRIEARQFHMRQLHPRTWGERTQVDVNDMSQLTVEERMRKAAELLDLVGVITGPRPQPPALEYRPEEPEDEEPPKGGIGEP